MTKLEVVTDSQLARNTAHDNNNNNMESDKRDQSECHGSKTSGGCAGKYLLRPRSVRSLRRCESDWNITESKRQKSRPAPLSKYRRKTANTRERCRMRQINTAFEKLRKMLPSWDPSPSSSTSSDMTKITTLKYACAYIRSLQDILDTSVTQHRLEGGGGEEDYAWAFSTMLDNTSLQEPTHPDTCLVPAPSRSPSLDARLDHDTDLMDLLCDSSDSGIFDDDLNSFPYLSPMCEANEVALLLLGADASYWHDPSHSHFTAC